MRSEKLECEPAGLVAPSDVTRHSPVIILAAGHKRISLPGRASGSIELVHGFVDATLSITLNLSCVVTVPGGHRVMSAFSSADFPQPGDHM
jgi:hypothetical protein